MNMGKRKTGINQLRKPFQIDRKTTGVIMAQMYNIIQISGSVHGAQPNDM